MLTQIWSFIHSNNLDAILVVVIGAANLIVQSNLLAPNTIVWKALHWLALNGPGVQKALGSPSKP